MSGWASDLSERMRGGTVGLLVKGGKEGWGWGWGWGYGDAGRICLLRVQNNNSVAYVWLQGHWGTR